MKTTQANYYRKLAPLFCALPLLAVTTQARANVISDWNDTAIRVIKAVNPNPIFASRALSMTHVAQFDAVNAVVGCYEPYATTLTEPTASPEAAAAQAAYHVLINLYPSQTAALDTALAASLSAVSDGAAKTDGIALGNAVAAVILALRANDGSAATVPYTPGSGPGVWVPTPPAFAPAVFPQWRYVTPWTMTAPEQFRPGPPPALDGATYTADFNEIKALGAVNSSIRTQDQTDVAVFLNSDAPWFMLGGGARFAVSARPLRLVDSARLFALLNMAMADALIAVWDAKFTYNFWRPVTAIRAADTDGNPATDPDPDWLPLIATPPHPEYAAAHTIISAAGATVLASVFGDEFTFAVSSPALPGKSRTFTRFSDFATESSNARVWGGVHWRNSTVVAAQMGHQIGEHALATVLRDIEPPVIHNLVANPSVLWPPNHRRVPIVVNVDATDNSGVAVSRIVAVHCNEPADGLGDGSDAPDWEITGDLTLNLRAERSGLGGGRIYTITVECSDPSANSVVRDVTVIVPHALSVRRPHSKLNR